MEDLAEIPLLQQPVNRFENGPNAGVLAASAKARHPVDSLQRTVQATNNNNNSYAFHNLNHVRRVYGIGLAMKLMTEQKLALQNEELQSCGGLPVTPIARDVLTGNDLSLDFADFMNLPQYRPDVNVNAAANNPHSMLEKHLGM